jgi:2-polyprenyl-6-methoxyphenol hydroxylase-like FAD-dependent oxidoreductase
MTLQTVDDYEPERVPTVGDHAIVVGGGMAGLLAARAVADGFERVSLVERDSLPSRPTNRRGVPQDRHVHVLLEAGRSVLESLCPDYVERLRSHGGVEIDSATDLDYYDEGAFLADSPEERPMVCASRPLFEGVLRECLAARDGIEIRDNTRFRTYTTDETAATVDGVVVETDDGERRELSADLVVDATGRRSRTPQWLADHGFDAPPTEKVGVDLAYSTVVVDRPPETRRGILVSPVPPRTRGGTVIPIENDQWVVTLFGLHGDHPPGDADGLQAFAESLPTPAIASLLDNRSWVSEGVDQYPFPASLRRRYEALDRFPDGLVVTGDALASFNPIYGQGMSVAALEALALHHALAGGREDLAGRFFDRAAESVDTAWTMAVGADAAFPQTDGPNPLTTRLFNWYVSRLIRAAHTDGRLSHEFNRVLQLERPPTALLRPSVLRRVLLPSG